MRVKNRSLFIISVALIVLFLFSFSFFIMNKRTRVDFDKKYTEIINEANKSSIYDSAFSLVSYNAEIIKLLYNGKLRNKQEDELLKIQRELFSDEFKEINSEEDFMSKNKEEIKKLKSKNFAIKHSLSSKPVPYEESEDIADVYLRLKTSKNYSMTIRYRLKKDFSDNNKWKIYAYEHQKIVKGSGVEDE